MDKPPKGIGDTDFCERTLGGIFESSVDKPPKGIGDLRYTFARSIAVGVLRGQTAERHWRLNINNVTSSSDKFQSSVDKPPKGIGDWGRVALRIQTS